MRLVNLMGCPKACSHFFFFLTRLLIAYSRFGAFPSSVFPTILEGKTMLLCHQLLLALAQRIQVALRLCHHKLVTKQGLDTQNPSFAPRLGLVGLDQAGSLQNLEQTSSPLSSPPLFHSASSGKLLCNA